MGYLEAFVERASASPHTFLLVLALFFLGWERVFPLRSSKRPAAHRIMVNVFLAGSGIVLAYWFVKRRFILWGAYEGWHYGILSPDGPFAERVWPAVARMSPGVRIVAGLVMADLTLYYWHRLSHVVPVLWRFHNVHHVDPDLDVTTAGRFHVVEYALLAIVGAAQTVVFGLDDRTAAVVQAVLVGALLFQHSNVRLPFWLERLLGLLLVTPRMHGIHHSVVKSESRSNYGRLLRIWDLLHGTLRLNVPQKEVLIGVAGYLGPGDSDLGHLLLMPFAEQRDYWRLPDGTWPERQLPPGESPRRMRP